MATQVQFRGGTTSEHSSFNGVAREITVDTTKQTVVVQDGSTNGGFPLLGEKNADNIKLHLGGNGTTDNGDLQIYHDGDHSRIDEVGDGSLLLQSNTNIQLNKGTSENMLIATADGAVELYYDGSGTPKFETKTFGAQITGAAHITGQNTVHRTNTLVLGHEGSSTSQIRAYGADASTKGTIDFKLSSNNGSASESTTFAPGVATFPGDILPAVNNLKSIGNGTLNFKDIWATNRFRGGDGVALNLGGSQDLIIRHVDGTGNLIESPTGSDLHIKMMGNTNDIADQTSAKFIEDGAVQLYYDGSANPKLSTTSTGVSFHDGNITNVGSIALDSIKGDADDNTNITFATGDIITFKCGTTNPALTVNTTQVKVEDNQMFVAGQGNDLNMYFSGNHSYLKSKTGNLYLMVSNTEYGAELHQNGKCRLNFDNEPKLETTASGITVTGVVTCTSVTETSDIALKTNIEPITNVLDKINQITGYKYDFTNSNSSSMGVIAQDVEKVFPELVHGEEGSKSLQYSGLIGALIESVKELSAKVAALESN